ncbi:hypothetical protein H072_5961 [Dactylellina haptotyla CBS 200.50]|uniref:Phenylalanine ammonia-lyase n=1 Tax=Dactylellina haptotyla (strain CBS 200.50) TaxID=1284197 RepID=S8BXW3_DACHA|nr:hypothetical protein H072_5961 [Dactylellina haptotyla CBS 200.50]
MHDVLVQLMPESQATSPHFDETLATLKECMKADKVLLDGESLSIAGVVAVAKKHTRADVTDAEKLDKRTAASVDCLREHLKKGYQVYGVSTGFGGSADSRTTNLTGLQTALLQTIQSGVLTEVDFAPEKAISDIGFHSMPASWVRATMLVRCNHLLRGHSGIRYLVLKSILTLLDNNMTPVVPLRGSISASGDLMPMAYIAGVLEGNPDIKVCWEKEEGTSIIPAPEALAAVGLQALTLGPKEGLGLLNGSSASTAVATLAIYETNQLLVLAQAIIGMACEALVGNAESFHHIIAAVRPHKGQIEVARNIRYFLQESKLAELPERKNRCRPGLFQDRYTLRGSSQWIGPQLEDMQLSTNQIRIELNSTQDNPVIDVETDDVYLGCNFQAASTTSAMEKARLSLQMAGKLLFSVSSELINPDLNRGLPSNLCTDDPSLSFHTKGVDINMAAYMSELAFLANPVSSHVQSAEMNNQSINSLALISARYTMQAVEIVSLMTAANLYVVCQALDLRALHTSFKMAFEEVIGNIVQEILADGMDKESLNRLHTILVATMRESWTNSSKDNLDVRCRKLSENLTGCVISMANAAKNNSGSDQVCTPTVKSIDLFAQRLQSESMSLFQSKLAAFVENPCTEDFLGRASKRLYQFVRHELAVPFHQGYDEHPTVPTKTKFGRERRTVGGWISIIYAALRDGRIGVPLADCHKFLPLTKSNESMNSHTNGTTNGVTNGVANGTNGAANEHPLGHMNGGANGHSNGHSHGNI